MDRYLEERLRDGGVILFLGAGSSFGAVNRLKKTPPGGEHLAELLADRLGLTIDPKTDRLPAVAAVARRKLGDASFNAFLDEQYGGCTPSPDQLTLANYSWKRIYTTRPR